MTRKEDYRCTMSSVYRSGRDFIKSSRMYYGLKFDDMIQENERRGYNYVQ